MNKSQRNAIQHLTSSADRANRLSSGEPLNGSINWRLEPAGRNHYMVVGSNVENHEWFEAAVLVIAIIGPRGRVRLSHVEGVSKQLIN